MKMRTRVDQSRARKQAVSGQSLPHGRGSHRRTGRNERGSGLLAVLWLSAALAAIAFSLSVTVRGEIERTSTEVDGLRCAYLASAGIERAAMELLWSATSTENKLIPKGSTFVNYVFPSGNVRVEIIPETAKLNVNKASRSEERRVGKESRSRW